MEFIWQCKFKLKSEVMQWTMFNKISVTPGAFIICLVFWKCFLYKCLSQLSSEIKSFSLWVPCSPAVHPGFICIGSSSGIKGVVIAPSCHHQWVLPATSQGTYMSYLFVLGKLNLNAHESAYLVSGHSGLLPFTVCLHVVLEFWPVELVALHEVPYAVWDALQHPWLLHRLADMINLQETCVLLEWQVDSVKGTCQCIRCLCPSGPEAGHLEVFLDFTDCTV